MYTYVADEGVMIRDADGVIVSPCQSAEDPNFIEYTAWALEGNQPTVVETRG